MYSARVSQIKLFECSVSHKLHMYIIASKYNFKDLYQPWISNFKLFNQLYRNELNVSRSVLIILNQYEKETKRKRKNEKVWERNYSNDTPVSIDEENRFINRKLDYILIYSGKNPTTLRLLFLSDQQKVHFSIFSYNLSITTMWLFKEVDLEK